MRVQLGKGSCYHNVIAIKTHQGPQTSNTTTSNQPRSDTATERPLGLYLCTHAQRSHSLHPASSSVPAACRHLTYLSPRRPCVPAAARAVPVATKYASGAAQELAQRHAGAAACSAATEVAASREPPEATAARAARSAHVGYEAPQRLASVVGWTLVRSVGGWAAAAAAAGGGRRRRQRRVQELQWCQAGLVEGSHECARRESWRSRTRSPSNNVAFYASTTPSHTFSALDVSNDPSVGRPNQLLCRRRSLPPRLSRNLILLPFPLRLYRLVVLFRLRCYSSSTSALP